ncbi:MULTISPECIES: glycine betaine ABC transporter substrate-binding protein [Paenibacillus]|uniref:glycine betaine ABC transporter substrate-binding protein n=1 Tax=Paenibacillus TaxID=44249 RepID=UPI00203BD275|nr:glycine betaine ABC transporter substrate-binding protein [Paenibacillus camelliae]MCM3634037.1 glycine betaine ABC transporter substrate-binding protein [Paenibacillus camelliae]
MKKKWLKLITAALAVMVIAAGCSNSSNGGNSSTNEKKEITLAYVAWDSEIASTNVVKEVFEERLGYKVNMLQVDAGPMFAGLADGSADAILAAWLPGTHASYMTEYGDRFEDLGPNLDGAKIGMVVPTYMDINSIEDLNSVGESLNYTITGIEPGAGIMEATNNALDEYELRDQWTLLESSSAAMTQELSNAYDKQEPIVVTGWTPHWKFAKMDLKYLEDPKGVYGAEEQIHTMVRDGLSEDQPEAYAFLDKFYWSPDDMAEVMIQIQDGKSPEEAAKAWVEANADKVDAWLAE